MAAAATATVNPPIADTVSSGRSVAVVADGGVWQIDTGEPTVAIFPPDIAVFVRAHRKLLVLCGFRLITRTVPVGSAASGRVGKSATDTGGCLRLLDLFASVAVHFVVL